MGPDFEAQVNNFVDNQILVHSVAAWFNKAQLQDIFEAILAPYAVDGWAIPSDPQVIIDTAIAKYMKFYTKPPVAPLNKTPFAYAYPDGTYMPTGLSLVGKDIGDTIEWKGITYYLINYYSGISVMKRWSQKNSQ